MSLVQLLYAQIWGRWIGHDIKREASLEMLIKCGRMSLFINGGLFN